LPAAPFFSRSWRNNSSLSAGRQTISVSIIVIVVWHGSLSPSDCWWKK
jgi:hypothetical protein